MDVVVVLLVSYLIGNVNPSILISKAIKNIDIREHNTKNAGASNTLVTLGFKWAALVAMIDIFKGFIVVYLVSQFYTDPVDLMVYAGLAVILGHIYPIFFQLKGGKGTATFFGLMLGLSAFVGLIFIIIFAASLFIFKYVTIATLIVVFLAPFYLLFFMEVHIITIVLMILFAFLSLFKHRSNLLNIYKHQETSVYEVLKKK